MRSSRTESLRLAIAVEAIRGEDRALDQRGGVDAGRDDPSDRARLELRRALGDQRRDDAQALGVDLVAETSHENP